MGLRIQTNVEAMNAHKNLSKTNAAMSKSLERLSSGYRINRSADDAAGLAIAGKLRVNVKSYVKAAENTAQANAMVQVAEGAMDQIENIMNRMKELATQAASANTDTDGRNRLNAEFTQLKEEIDRIANTTAYGGTDLINGNFGAEVSATGAVLSSAGSASVSGPSAVDVSGHIGASGAIYTIHDAAGTGIELTNGSITQGLTLSGTGAQTINFDALGVKITTESGYDGADLDGGIFTVTNTAQNIQVGSNDDANDKISLSMANMDTSETYNASQAVSAWGVSTVSAALTALDDIDTAVSFVTEKRGDLGAIQNRLGYAAANLATSIENVSAAESTIRDVDMAAEMTSFTKSQIMSQAGTSMLAQANMAAQQVLSLLG
jgi:flagellin